MFSVIISSTTHLRRLNATFWTVVVGICADSAIRALVRAGTGVRCPGTLLCHAGTSSKPVSSSEGKLLCYNIKDILYNCVLPAMWEKFVDGQVSIFFWAMF